jgi:hypothetical protein
MRELSVDDFSRALARYGFAVSGNRIFDVSGRCPGKSWPIVLNTTLQIDRRRTIRIAALDALVRGPNDSEFDYCST